MSENVEPNTTNATSPIRRRAYRLECKYVALTYPNCDRLDPESLHTFLTTGIDPNPDFACISAERHQNGVPHYHALLFFRDGIRTRNARFFDHDGRHPNVQSCRTPKSWYEYVKKEGDYREFGVLPSKLSSGGGGDWSTVVASSETREQFLDAVRAGHPRDWVLFNDRILSYADTYFAKKDEYTSPDVDFRVPAELQQWVTEQIQEVGVVPQHSYSDVSLILVFLID